MATKRSFGTVRKLPSGRYQVRYRRHGKQLSSGQTFATKADANAHLAALETDLARGAIFSPDVGKVRFGEDARRWLDERDIQPRTRETHESQLKWINDTFELAVLNEITPGDVRAWHGQLVRSRLHPNSVSKIYRMLRTIFTTAVDDGLIKVNPAHVKGASREATVERPLLEWDQVTALANAIEPRFSAMIWLAATSGLRFGELTALRPSDFDFERATVTVRHSLAFRRGSGPTVGSPKTSSAHRTVSVPAPVLAKVERHIESYIDDVYGATFVFTSMKGRPLLNRYAALFPEQAGRMVLDGAVDPSLSAIQQNLRQAGGFQLAFDDYLADCLANDCPLGSAADEVEAKVTELFATAAATPLPTGNPERPLTQTLAVYGIFAPLYAPDVWPVLTESLTAAFDGDGTLLLAAADQYTGRGPDEYSSNQAQAQTAITCLDAQIPGEPDSVPTEDDFLAASPLFGAQFYGLSEVGCDTWPIEPTVEAPDYSAAGAAPILVVGATGDPATPIEEAEYLADVLDSGVLLIRDGDGPTSYFAMNSCITSAVDSFLLDGTVPEDGTECPNETTTPDSGKPDDADTTEEG